MHRRSAQSASCAPRGLLSRRLGVTSMLRLQDYPRPQLISLFQGVRIIFYVTLPVDLVYKDPTLIAHIQGVIKIFGYKLGTFKKVLSLCRSHAEQVTPA